MGSRPIMNLKKFLRRGRMPSSLEHVRRFSMCNCLTIPLPDTYTAHGMTIDYLVRRAVPGEATDVFKIPKRVDTFLFSPFNEAFNYARIIKGVRYTRAWRGPSGLWGECRKHPVRWTLARFRKELLRLARRVAELWESALKILVLYDNSRASDKVRERVQGFDDVAVETLDWPLVQVRCGRFERRKPWHHYAGPTLLRVLSEIERLEETCAFL